ncbi:SDR family NAD(P)-dependent oxidoreductase [Burkholderia sp. Ac-20344]|uniref:SDR family oxidoreductase n=1 Tax=Burkholderia sp. Ac-20344 TaxID=2703890 RepID=UPI00197BEC3F|nr:SDR family NAD(P)-dependent oxidoreductase [Burkholderia sp. Ac-20344]MBN3836067.1 SDR family NAD(P)-dependent oxidoreductase [Burkholderia sp. Ac-20344]
MKLTGNTVFITGGASGIGRGIAEALHRKGNKVIISGRRQELLDEVVKANPGMDAVRLDVTSPVQIEQVAKALIATYPALNVVFNNAGIMPFDDVTRSLDDSQAVHLINTNLLGPVRVSAAFVEHLKKQPDAAIINTSSTVAFIPMVMFALYSATKAAIHSYTLSQRFALRDTSVHVLELAPPWVDTDLVHKSGDPRAMQVEPFVEEALKLLETATTEVVVEAARQFRNAVGPNEHGVVEQFNQFIIDNPLPLPTP